MITKPKTIIDLAQIESLASRGLSQEQIANSLGFSAKTFENRKKDSSEFAEAVKRGRAKGIAFVTNKLMDQIKEGSIPSTIFFLKTQAGWHERQEHTGASGGPIMLANAQMSDEELVKQLHDRGLPTEVFQK